MDVLKGSADILNIIEHVSITEGLKNHEIFEVQVNEKGEGFMGQIFFVTLKDKDSKKELSLLLKSALQDEKIRAHAPVRISFENEVRFYEEIYPHFLEFERFCGAEEAADLVPKCYKTSLQNGSEIVVLQNLKALGFEAFPKSSLMDHGHVKMMFETYARFHAYSFAYKDQHPEEFERLASKLSAVSLYVANSEGFMKMFEEYMKLAKAFFSPRKEEHILRRLRKYETKEDISKVFRDCTKGGCEYPVIAHGDSWSNNMMFKYETNRDERKPKDMRIIDMQAIQLASPVCDLSFCLYSGGCKEVFDNLEDYLKIYHEALSSCLRRLGTDSEKVFPFCALKDQWQRFAKFGVLATLMIARVKVTYEGQGEDFTDFSGSDNGAVGDVFLNPRCDEELYKERVVDVVRHAVEIDVL